MFQIDCTEIHEGDSLTVTECESIIGLSRKSEAYQLNLLMLRNQIEDSLSKLGRPLTVRATKGCIQVLTQAEAIEYNPRVFASGKKKMRLAHRRMLAVNITALNSNQRREHSDMLAKMGRTLQLIRTRKPLSVPAYVNRNPKRS